MNKMLSIKLEKLVSEDEIIEMLHDYLTTEEMIVFVAKLNKKYQDWDSTLRLSQHFKALEEDYSGETINGLQPKKIKTDE